MKPLTITAGICWIALTFTQAVSGAAAQTQSSGAVADPLKESNKFQEIWLNAGFYSYHFDHSQNLNNNNIGLGLEYRYSTTSALTVGSYYNSDRKDSLYAAMVWEPISLGDVRIGGLVGVLNGYHRANNGGWIPMILPAASYEYKNIGVNLTIIPPYKDLIYGSISLQLKFKMF